MRGGLPLRSLAVLSGKVAMVLPIRVTSSNRTRKSERGKTRTQCAAQGRAGGGGCGGGDRHTCGTHAGCTKLIQACSRMQQEF